MSKEQVEEKPFKVAEVNIDCDKFNKEGYPCWIEKLSKIYKIFKKLCECLFFFKISYLFKVDNDIVGEAFDLYEQLNIKHEILTIIPPQFETPLPPLQLAVFDLIIKDFPQPNLELFDLDE